MKTAAQIIEGMFPELDFKNDRNKRKRNNNFRQPKELDRPDQKGRSNSSSSVGGASAPTDSRDLTAENSVLGEGTMDHGNRGDVFSIRRTRISRVANS